MGQDKLGNLEVVRQHLLLPLHVDHPPPECHACHACTLQVMAVLQRPELHLGLLTCSLHLVCSVLLPHTAEQVGAELTLNAHRSGLNALKAPALCRF